LLNIKFSDNQRKRNKKIKILKIIKLKKSLKRREKLGENNLIK